MKIGDYVRTPYGIAKIKNIFCETGYVFIETDNEIGDCSMIDEGVLRKGIIVMENDYENFRENNVKERPIDLIEAGDYVNGMLVIEETPKDKRKKQQIIVDSTAFEWGEEILFNEDIKSIVTKEQFESMEYKVVEQL